MVRSVKEHIRKTVQKQVLTLDRLETTIVECDSMINARPLTYVSGDGFDGTRRVITPDVLIKGRRHNRPDDRSAPPEMQTDPSLQRSAILERDSARQECIREWWDSL